MAGPAGLRAPNYFVSAAPQQCERSRKKADCRRRLPVREWRGSTQVSGRSQLIRTVAKDTIGHMKPDESRA